LLCRFELVSSAEHETFGLPLVAEIWELDLTRTHERQHQAPGQPDIIGRSPAGVESKQRTTRWFPAAEAAFVTS
jgi:hypothetical protein